MIVLWLLLGLLATLVVTSQVAGHLLSDRFEGRVTAEYDAPAERVWDALMDYERHPMTGRMKKGVVPQPDEHGLPCWVEDMGHGELIRVRTTAADRPRRLVREMSSERVDMTSRWEYALEPAGTGCRVLLRGVTHIRGRGFMERTFRFMMLVGGGVRKGLVIQLTMVGATLGAPARLSG